MRKTAIALQMLSIDCKVKWLKAVEILLSDPSIWKIFSMLDLIRGAGIDIQHANGQDNSWLSQKLLVEFILVKKYHIKIFCKH